MKTISTLSELRQFCVTPTQMEAFNRLVKSFSLPAVVAEKAVGNVMKNSGKFEAAVEEAAKSGGKFEKIKNALTGAAKKAKDAVVAAYKAVVAFIKKVFEKLKNVKSWADAKALMSSVFSKVKNFFSTAAKSAVEGVKSLGRKIKSLFSQLVAKVKSIFKKEKEFKSSSSYLNTLEEQVNEWYAAL